MRRFTLFLLSFAVVLSIAVFLTPILFHHLPFKFERIFNRIVMIGVLICVALFVRLRRENLDSFGLRWQADSLKLLALAFISPIIVLSVFVAVQTHFGEASLSLQPISAAKWVGRILGACLTGFLIGTIEEVFFRGAAFQSLLGLWASPIRRPETTLVEAVPSHGLIASAVLVSAFYSIVHFVSAQKPFVDQSPDFRDSLRVLAAPFQSLIHFSDYWPGFVGLFIFGLMLIGLLLRTRSLYPAIGLHAGAVFFIKSDGWLVDFGNSNLLWGSSKMYDGLMGWLTLGILYFVLIILLSRITNHKPRITP